MNNDIHLGHIIREELERQRRTVTWLAETINCERSNCYYIFNRKYIDLEMLERICKALHHNFFKHLSDNMDSVLKLST